MAVAKWLGVLSTTEPRNDVGIIKVRQGNINSEIAEFQIVQNNKPYDLTGLTVYFCASFGLNLVEKPAVVVNTTGGKIQYTFDDDSMQSVGRQKGYFSIKKEESKIDSTQEFEYQVESSLMTRSIDGKSYIYKLSVLIKLLDDYAANGQENFDIWFESVKEILYGVDPGGNILRELIEARTTETGQTFDNLKARLNDFESKTTAQLEQAGSKVERVSKSRIVNISIDDFSIPLKDITENQGIYTSVFDNEIFKKLKELHDNYGAEFSLFCFTNNNFDISTTTTKFKDELAENAIWLKFGFHGKDNATYYDVVSHSQFVSDYEKCINAIKSFSSVNNLCKVIRLHGYRANTQVMQSLANYGIEGVFAADDNRVSYDLSQEETDELNKKDVIRKNGINYYKTHVRLEAVLSANLLKKLNELKNKNYLALFTHDYAFMEHFVKIENSVKFMTPNAYSFDSFEKIPQPEFLPLTDYEYTGYIFGTSWGVRTGQALKIIKSGDEVKIQGQLSRSIDVGPNSIAIILEESLRPKTTVVTSIIAFTQTATVTVKALVQPSGELVIGFRDDQMPVSMRDIGINVWFFAK